MAFVQAKADALKTSADKIHVIVAEKKAAVVEFEKALKANAGEQAFFYIAEQGEANAEGIIFYKELAWFKFHGPLSGAYTADWHFTFRSFKCKAEDYGNERKYIDTRAFKVVDDLAGSTLEDKEFAIKHFDAFLDAFKADIDKKLA